MNRSFISAAGIGILFIALSAANFIQSSQASYHTSTPISTPTSSPTSTVPWMWHPRVFHATLTGSEEVPAVTTNAKGKAKFKVDRWGTELEFSLKVKDGMDITMAHLHCAPKGQSGPVVAYLFGMIPGGFDVDGDLAEFTLTNANIIGDAACPTDINTIQDLVDEIRKGNIYANVHSVQYPNGLIRGQVK